MEAHAGAVGAGVAAGAEVVARERVGRLVKRYIIWSTLFLLVAGLLGVLMRQSQADMGPLEDNFFYAIMTAHGLGAFVSWAGFAVMGLALWVLSNAEFPMRPFGYALAEATFWLMVVGTLGIVATTVFFGFAGSWVFLYPLPFFSSGRWGDGATAGFSFSVLLVGVAIITWCVAVLHTLVGPGSPSERGGVLTKIGVSLGLGFIAPKRFPTRRRLPYVALPLATIAIDMIIATLPLAVLLVEMIVQSFDPDVSVDPLLAKNVLWFFGHPVVYLLLFPAVAVYYALIPRYAGRDLVAGNIIAVAWVGATIVNVVIWAHHVYLDYPEGSVQGAINIAMQPLTFTITLVSALSIYSLSATIFRSRFNWTPASTLLVAGVFGWFTAGISGVVNATIDFDEVVHNTLWIVGHFHHMALLNIGIVVFAGVYAYLPELTGKEWYSRHLAWWHVWLTLIGGYGMIIPWLIQGLLGAPRRYSILPEGYDGWTYLAIPFVGMIALGQLYFAWNLLATMRGKHRAEDEQPWRRDAVRLGWTTGAIAVFALTPLLIVLTNRLQDEREGIGGGSAQAEASPGGGLFADTCGSCHVLEAAGTKGAAGPDLDQLGPDAQRVLRAIERGGTGSGAMPQQLLAGPDAQQVADFVAKNAGK